MYLVIGTFYILRVCMVVCEENSGFQVAIFVRLLVMALFYMVINLFPIAEGEFSYLSDTDCTM